MVLIRNSNLGSGFFFFLVTVWTRMINPDGCTKFGREVMWVSLPLLYVYVNWFCSSCYVNFQFINWFGFLKFSSLFWMSIIKLWQLHQLYFLCIGVHYCSLFGWWLFDFRYVYCYFFDCDDWSSIINNWKLYNCTS